MFSVCSPAARLEVRRLGGEAAARRVHALPRRLERGRQRVLRQPVDLQAGHERAQLTRDRDVAPRVAEADRRGHEERAAGPRGRPRPAPRRGGSAEHARRELVDQDVHLDRVARDRRVARSLHHHQLAAGELGDPAAALDRRDPVAVPVDREHGAADAGQQPLRLLARDPRRRRVHRVLEHRAPGVEAPADAVLDRLLAVALREHRADEVLDEAGEVPPPGGAREARPALVDARVLVEGELVPPRVVGRQGRQVGRERDHTGDPARVDRGSGQRGRGAQRQPGDDRALSPGGVEHGHGVQQVAPVERGVIRAVRAAATTGVERDHAEPPRQIRDLELPHVRADDRPRGREQDRAIGVAEDLVADADPVDLDLALNLRLERAHRARS